MVYQDSIRFFWESGIFQAANAHARPRVKPIGDTSGKKAVGSLSVQTNITFPAVSKDKFADFQLLALYCQ